MSTQRDDLGIAKAKYGTHSWLLVESPAGSANFEDWFIVAWSPCGTMFGFIRNCIGGTNWASVEMPWIQEVRVVGELKATPPLASRP